MKFSIKTTKHSWSIEISPEFILALITALQFVSPK